MNKFFQVQIFKKLQPKLTVVKGNQLSSLCYFLVFYLLIGINITSLQAQNCNTGNISLLTQADVDNFQATYGSCTRVSGNLRIGVFSGSNITNLNGLSGLTSVGGDLIIRDNATLTNIDGLSALTSVEGDLSISGSVALTNIDGLLGLTSVGERLAISRNAALTNIDGLSALTFLGGSLSIDNNAALTNMNGLSALTSVGEGLSIGSNNILTNIDALSGLTSVGGSLNFGSNAALTNIDGLSGLTSVGGSLSIGSNAALTNIDGLSGLTFIELGLVINDNATLTNIDGLSDVTSIGGALSIGRNAALKNIDGLSGVTSIGQSLLISDNATLTNIDDLSGLTSIGGDLIINDNATLTNIDGLSGVIFIGGGLSIGRNAVLTNIDGLSSLTSIEGNFIIQDNPQLSECCALSNLFDNGIIEGITAMSNNAGNCNNDGADIMNNCIGTAPPCFTGDLILTSQADVNAFDPTCETIEGDCIIRGADITDLSPLAGITTINGNVTIGSSDGTLSNELLTTLEGLSGLVTITGRLNIINCAVLTSVEGLSALETIGGVTIRNCPQLQAIFFPVLVSVGGNCNYISLPQVTVIGNPNGGGGTGGIQSLGGGIIFDDVPMLTDINGLANLTSLGGDLFIIGASALTNVDAFITLTNINGCVHLIDNPLLTDLSGLDSLENVGGNIRVDSNATITNLDNFAGIIEIGGSLFLRGNANLTNLDGLSQLESIGDSLIIVGNSELSDCCVFNDLLQNESIDFVMISDNKEGCNSIEDINQNCTDADGDGFVLKDDCDDTMAGINPDAMEIPNDGIDQNCDNVDGEPSCPDLGLNIGAVCTTSDGAAGTVNSDCDCMPTGPNCPDLGLNIGAACTTTEGAVGIVSADCDCMPTGPNCPDLGLNIGAACTTTDGAAGTVNADCDCMPTGPSCPDLGLNIGAVCTTTEGAAGIVSADCDCMPTGPSCPNIGATCTTSDDENGVIDVDCNCVKQMGEFCPEYNAFVGSACDDNDPTTEDEWLEEGCKCVGKVINGCNLTLRAEGNSIIAENVDDPRNKVYVWDRTFSNLLYESCAYWTDCQGNQTFSNLLPGVYAVQYQSFSEDWTKIYCDSTAYIEIGGVPTTNACDAVSLTVDGDQLTISNLSSLNTVIDIFDYEYASVFRCVGDCGTSQTVANLAQGKNIIRVKIYDAEWNFVCEREDIIEVTGTGITFEDDRNSLRPTISTETTNLSLTSRLIKVSPNPASETIRVDLADFIGLEVDLVLMDMLGRVVLHQHFDALNAISQNIDIQSFKAGVYQVSAIHQGKATSTKLIIIQ